MHFNSWDEYNKNTKDNPPRPLCQEAVALVKSKHNALDVGAGALNDSRYLLGLGFNVLAVDSNQSISKLAKDIQNEKLEVKVANLEDYQPPANTFDYINAMFVLPFVKQDSLRTVFNRLYDSLTADGVMAFQLFGDKDDWVTIAIEQRFHKDMSFLNSEQVAELLTGKHVIKNEESISDGKLANGDTKKGHQFDIIIQKQ